MKKLILIPTLVFAFLTPALAQEDEEFSRDSRIEAYRIAFFTKRLNLTSSEAEKFWPVYNAFLDKQEALRKKTASLQMKAKNAYMDDDNSKLEKLSDDFIAIKKEEYDIASEYHEKFKDVLPIRKVIMLYKTENDFKKVLLEEIRKRQMEKRQQMQNRRNR